MDYQVQILQSSSRAALPPTEENLLHSLLGQFFEDVYKVKTKLRGNYFYMLILEVAYYMQYYCKAKVWSLENNDMPVKMLINLMISV